MIFFVIKVTEKPEVEFARTLWQSDNSKAGQALAIIEKINCVEKFMLTGLSECKPNDFLGAFQYVRYETKSSIKFLSLV